MYLMDPNILKQAGVHGLYRTMIFRARYVVATNVPMNSFVVVRGNMREACSFCDYCAILIANCYKSYDLFLS